MIKKYFIYINQHETVWECDWSWLDCRNTWQPAGTSGQTLAQLRSSGWGEDNCKLSDWAELTQKPDIFPTGLDWTVACVISHVGYNVKPAAMETNSYNIVKNTLS